MPKLFKKKTGNKDEIQRQKPSVPRPATFRYHAVRSQESPQQQRRSDSSQAKQKTSRSLIETVSTGLFLLVILGSLAYMFWLDTMPNIRLAKASEGSETVFLADEETYTKAAQNILKGSFSTRTKLTINTTEVANKMKQQFPELSEVTVTIPLAGQRPIISLQAKKPVMLLRSADGTFVVDEYGVALDTLTMVSETVLPQLSNLPVVEEQGGLSVQKGTFAASAGTVAFVRQLHHQYQNKGLGITKITLPGDKPNEVRVTATNEPYFVKYVVNRSAGLQFGTYQALRLDLEERGITPQEYIDVRVQEKAYYK